MIHMISEDILGKNEEISMQLKIVSLVSDK